MNACNLGVKRHDLALFMPQNARGFMFQSRLHLPILALCSALALAACESDADKAARYFKSGMSLLEAGDTDRAMLEFRNVFRYDGFHKAARQAYADTLLARGETSEAYAQYLRLIEQYPDTADVRITLAELAITRADWPEAERHGHAAIELAPDRAEAQIIKTALDYHKAVRSHDDEARARLGEQAHEQLEANPDNPVARRVSIDYLAQDEDPTTVLSELDDAIAAEPDILEFHMLKLRQLSQSGDSEGLGEQLELMQETFPEDERVRDMLIRWYMAKRDHDAAEALLRKIAGDDTGPAGMHLSLVQFLEEVRGPDAARDELSRLIAANEGQPNGQLYRATLAGMDFNAGDHAGAITRIEEILRDAEESDQTRRIKLALAKMLDATGNRVGARSRIEEVLEHDTTNVEALRMRANWLIAEDRPRDAIIDLRKALDQDPRDSATLMQMASAHQREGDMELAGERLAAAVEASGGGVTEAMTYARFLLDQDKVWVARRVLNDARRANPNNVEILSTLAGLHVNAGEWPQAHQIIEELRGIDSPPARASVRALDAAVLAAQNGIDEALDFLRREAENGDPGAFVMAIESLVRAGRQDEARQMLTDEMAKKPDDLGLRMLSANLHAIAGENDIAEQELRALIDEDPKAAEPVRLLYSLLVTSGRHDDAGALLSQAQQARPDALDLLLLQAGEMENIGDYEGAIAIYERLYAQDSSNVLVANNLASLITTHRDDAESLERAHVIARRFRDANNPALNDTYGWIEYRRGNHAEAVKYLEPAAAGLPQDALVQFHLGMAYVAVGRNEDAVHQLQQALDLAGDSTLGQFDTAREQLKTLTGDP